MKKFILLSSVVAVLAFASSKAAAVLTMTISGTAEVQKSNTETKTAYVGTTASSSFSNKQIYTIVSNAVASVADWAGTNIASIHLPADGVIVFNPGRNSGTTGLYPEIDGTFYVTNKSGFYFPLSGMDASGQYYSWMELDCQNSDHVQNGLFLDFTGPFNGVAAYNIGISTGKGTVTENSTGLFYVHDDPYSYDDADSPNIFYSNYLGQGLGNDLVGGNDNALEIRGLMTASLTIVDNDVNGGSLSLTGQGNLIYLGNAGFLIKTGTAKFK